MSRFYEVSNTEIINLDEIAFVEFTDQEDLDNEPRTKIIKMNFRGVDTIWNFYLTTQEREKLRQVLIERNRIC